MAAGKITRVRLTNYRSIGTCDVHLQDLTLLVGPNGAGKSNFIDSLRFLKHSMSASLEEVIGTRFGSQGVFRKLPGGQTASRFSITVDFLLGDGKTGSYALTVRDQVDGLANVERVDYRVGEDSFSSPAFTEDRSALAAFGSQPAFLPVYYFLSGMQFYSPEPAKMRLPRRVGAVRVLSGDASNAADVLAWLQRESPDTARRISSYLAAFVPGFQDVTVTETNRHRWLAFTPVKNPSGWTFISSDVSDGVLRAIAILLAIFQPHTGGPPIPLVGLEEPESNLHPAAAAGLLDAFLEAGKSVPIVVSTHSADLLDRKDLPANSLVTVAMRDGQTVIRHVDDAVKTTLAEGRQTAGALLRNNALAPRAN